MCWRVRLSVAGSQDVCEGGVGEGAPGVQSGCTTSLGRADPQALRDLCPNLHPAFCRDHPPGPCLMEGANSQRRTTLLDVFIHLTETFAYQVSLNSFQHLEAN